LDLADFLNKHKYDFQDHKILDLLDIFLIPHTNFFRNNRQFEALKCEVIPECIAHMDYKNIIDLRIWSAGCSTGEEAYSILVSLMEYFGDEYWEITCGIMATDISRKSLKVASKGIYETKRIDKIIHQRILEYTEQESDGKLRFKEKVRKEANFKELNLNSKTFPFKNKFHIIFCRNILIYLNKESRLAAENKIFKSLEEGGFIFLGDAEVLNSKDHKFEQLGNGIYRKRI
jgi:chemotaxis protein methyltransferase CheR